MYSLPEDSDEYKKIVEILKRSPFLHLEYGDAVSLAYDFNNYIIVMKNKLKIVRL